MDRAVECFACGQIKIARDKERCHEVLTNFLSPTIILGSLGF